MPQSRTARRRRRRRPADPPAETSAGYARALAEAQAAHAAAQAAIDRADSKAQWAASIAAGALGALVAAQPVLGPPSSQVLLLAGVALLFGAVGMAGLVIIPRLARRHAARTRDPMYFGGLRHWRPDRLAEHLATQRPKAQLQAWCRQATQVARIAWRKHTWSRWSLLAALAGTAVVVAAYLL